MKKRIYLLCEPKHANLGDQAQLMCTLKWLNENYPEYKVVCIGTMFGAFDYTIKSRLQTFTRLLKFLYLKITIRRDDIFVGHSGYFFIDHHIGWLTYAFFIRYFPKHKMIILPQTINFYSPVAKQMAINAFSSKSNLTLLCRDEVSFDKAKKIFGKTKLLLFPDIVTSLIGTMHFNNKREGILICARNDVEAFYTKDDLLNFLGRFNCKRKELTDTTISASQKEMSKNRDQLILEKIKYFSTFQIVVTDRYHGTIFSAIASTPVIVINSADHKLNSGVKWFPRDVFGDYVQFADNLNEAFNMANDILSKKELQYNNPPYFKEKYWDKLKEILDK